MVGGRGEGDVGEGRRRGHAEELTVTAASGGGGFRRGEGESIGEGEEMGLAAGCVNSWEELEERHCSLACAHEIGRAHV